MYKLKKYIDNQIRWTLTHIDTEVKSIREAVNKVETTNTAKFEAQNEWRGQFKDQTSTFVTRRELWGAIIAILAIVVSAAAIFYKNK